MNTPYWQEIPDRSSYPPLEGDLQTGALVIGGGITGITAAWLLRKAGMEVTLVERGKLCSGETSHTTAHLTYMTDTRLCDLVKTFGEDKAKLAWQGGRQAMEFIRDTVSELRIECDWQEVDGYLAAAPSEDRDTEVARLQYETRLAAEMGFDVVYSEACPPDLRPGIVFRDQFKFHPLKYLHALAAKAAELGVKIHEDSEALEIGGKTARVNGHTVHFDKLVIATHVPLQGSSTTLAAALFQTKIWSYSTYAIGAETTATIDEMIWSDTADPFLYLRVEKRGDGRFLILGGEDHRTGQMKHTEDAFSLLVEAMKQFTPEFNVTHHWSGQVVETIDGLPYIGLDHAGQFLATGFSGNGLTFGTLAAMMAVDAFASRENPWADLFSISRIELAAVPDYLEENKDFPVRMVTDRFGIPEGEAAGVEPGCGCLLKVKGEKVAVYRDSEGSLHALNPICPHLGCVVAWNEAEQTWDCPCHGSRFTGKGGLIAGPAEEGLKPFEKAV